MTIEKGKARAKLFLDYLKKMKDGKYVIKITKYRRTTAQNNLYWMYLQIIGKETGDDFMELHEYLKREFLAPKFITVLGKTVKIPNSTTKLDKLQFGEYLDKIERLTGVPIPDTEAWLKGN